MFFAIMHENFHLALCYILYGAISDFLDGYFARLYNQCSDFGALADALADKIFINFAVLGFHFFTLPENNMLRYLLINWVVRDIILTISWAFSKKKFKSLYIGKVYTALQFSFLFTIVMMKIFGMDVTLFLLPSFILFITISFITLIQYLKLMLN